MNAADLRTSWRWRPWRSMFKYDDNFQMLTRPRTVGYEPRDDHPPNPARICQKRKRNIYNINRMNMRDKKCLQDEKIESLMLRCHCRPDLTGGGR